ncbi:MAG: putative addiction module antidote protein [Alphaproteobacteria bacterium]|nr:putative addiction module antidote protein [Alphaproteobacteria bacterium]
MAKTKHSRFDAADYLRNPATIAEYLTACLEDPDPAVFVAALGDVARAKGMMNIARKAGLGRESLYKALEAGSQPRHETVRRVVEALGLKLTLEAA